jgi:hypothetical protein
VQCADASHLSKLSEDDIRQHCHPTYSSGPSLRSNDFLHADLTPEIIAIASDGLVKLAYVPFSRFVPGKESIREFLLGVRRKRGYLVDRLLFRARFLKPHRPTDSHRAMRLAAEHDPNKRPRL